MVAPSRALKSPEGLLAVDKPPGRTSRAVVDQVVHVHPRGARPKAGHAGTLDPLATGVLVIALGRATRLIEVVQAGAKSYLAKVRLGATSDTNDADGDVVEVFGAVPPPLSAIEAAVGAQVGTILQRPPEHSALKVSGRRAYDLARAGLAFELAPRPVRIDQVLVMEYRWPFLNLQVDCGSGTYVRSIARDLGEALGCGALIQELRRARVGPFLVENALTWDELDAERIAGALLPMDFPLADWPKATLDPQGLAHLRQGRSVPVPDRPPGPIALYGPEGEFVATAEVLPEGNVARPTRVFVVD